jgi:hypothetical protein
MNTTSRNAKAIFLDLIRNVPRPEWDARLGEVCGGDEDLLCRVGDLLHAHVRTGSFLDEPAVAADVTIDVQEEAWASSTWPSRPTR